MRIGGKFPICDPSCSSKWDSLVHGRRRTPQIHPLETVLSLTSEPIQLSRSVPGGSNFNASRLDQRPSYGGKHLLTYG